MLLIFFGKDNSISFVYKTNEIRMSHFATLYGTNEMRRSHFATLHKTNGIRIFHQLVAADDKLGLRAAVPAALLAFLADCLQPANGLGG